VTREIPAKEVFAVFVVSQALRASEVTVARRATKATRAKSARRVREVKRARSAIVGKKEIKGKRVPKAHLDPKVFVAKKVKTEIEENREKREMLVPKVNKAFKGNKESGVSVETKDCKVK
jgi:hypothetical protein